MLRITHPSNTYIGLHFVRHSHFELFKVPRNPVNCFFSSVASTVIVVGLISLSFCTSVLHSSLTTWDDEIGVRLESLSCNYWVTKCSCRQGRELVLQSSVRRSNERHGRSATDRLLPSRSLGHHRYRGEEGGSSDAKWPGKSVPTSRLWNTSQEKAPLLRHQHHGSLLLFDVHRSTGGYTVSMHC